MEMTVGNAKTFYLCIFYENLPCLNVINYLLITESEVVRGKSQTEASPYWPSDSEVNTVGRGLRYFRND